MVLVVAVEEWTPQVVLVVLLVILVMKDSERVDIIHLLLMLLVGNKDLVKVAAAALDQVVLDLWKVVMVDRVLL
tara:strand:+ start:63 stop:284 length:222 start_codon:yes stop_codon:yes gene_type:complete